MVDRRVSEIESEHCNTHLVHTSGHQGAVMHIWLYSTRPEEKEEEENEEEEEEEAAVGEKRRQATLPSGTTAK